MRFVDTNVWMNAVGRPHPLREKVRTLLRDAAWDWLRLVTSAELLQELLHADVPVGRRETLAAALRLARARAEVVPLVEDDVVLATDLLATDPGLGARDLVHLAVALRVEAAELWTSDRGLGAAFDARS